MMKNLILLVGVVAAMTSCTPTLSTYTQKMQDNFNWSEEEMRGIQFYLSETVVLRREAQKGDVSVREGKIKVVNGRKVEEIVFERGTEGVYVFSPGSDQIAVSFEGGDDRYLIFGPNPKIRGKYVLLAKDWDRNSGKVKYDGKIYNISTTDSAAGLEVNLDRIQKTSIDSRTARGRKIK